MKTYQELKAECDAIIAKRKEAKIEQYNRIGDTDWYKKFEEHATKVISGELLVGSLSALIHLPTGSIRDIQIDLAVNYEDLRLNTDDVYAFCASKLNEYGYNTTCEKDTPFSITTGLYVKF